jgi:hypothetical protein
MSFQCECDGEPATIYEASRHRARKQYRCDECHGPITAGQTYERAQMLYDGQWTGCMTCADCLAIRDFVKISVPCFCFLHGDMLNNAKETVYAAAAYAPDETVGLRFGFLRRVRAAEKRRLSNWRVAA